MKKYAPRRAEFHDPASEVLRPIVGVDIDGTLGQYHLHFTRFAEDWLGRELPDPEDFRTGSFASHLGIAKSTYRKIKLAYRRGGAKRSMPVFDGASEFTAALRSRGALVVLCTTRPYLSLEGVDEDTRHWAARNRIQYDSIIWGEYKYRDLSRFGQRVVSILDDEPAMLKQAMDCGILANGMRRSYNEFAMANEWWTRLKYAMDGFDEQLDKWEERHRA